MKDESKVCHFSVRKLFTLQHDAGLTLGIVVTLYYMRVCLCESVCVRVNVCVLTFEMVPAGLPPLVKG